ncbi:phosphopantothenoylcysteine decarboxylase [bacterium]|nr:phosphopantothenoylcysteine decarboxylase [bacterium]
MKIAITAGPTREPIDDVRYISNASSGKLGIALARAALERHHEVTLVLGPVEIAPPEGVRLVRVETTGDLERACREVFPSQDALIMAAAPADFRLKERIAGKIAKEGKDSLSLELVPNPDVVAGLGRMKRPDQVILGFALESGEGGEVRALAKIVRKNLDAIALNSPENLGSERASVSLYRAAGGAARVLADLPKDDLARELVREVEEILREKRERGASP